MDTHEIETLISGMVPSLRSIAPQGLIAGVLPVVVYAAIRPRLSSDVEGLLIILVFPLAEIAYEAARTRRVEPIGIISIAGITLGVVTALAFGGDATLLKVRNSAVTGAFGCGCLISLVLSRPAMWHLARAFATEGDIDRRNAFDTLWAIPGIPVRFNLITLIWGGALVAEAAVQLSLALVLRTGEFLAASVILNVTVLTGLIAGTRAFVRSNQTLLMSAVVVDGRGIEDARTDASAPFT